MNRIDLSQPELRLLHRILREQARSRPDAPFLIRGDDTRSFAAVERDAQALARALARLGIGAGDRIAMLLSGRLETVLVPFAASLLGAVWTPVSTDYKGEWLADTLARCRAGVIVTEAAYLPRLEAVRDRLDDLPWVVVEGGGSLPAGAHDFEALLAAPAPALERERGDRSSGELCSILWTSGTTGRSKGVLQSHENWLRPIEHGAGPQYQSRPGDVIYNVLPLFNSAAWVTSIFRALVEGLPCVLDGPFSVTHFWERIRHYGATQTFTLGAMHMFLWNAPERAEDADNPLRVAQMVPMPPEVARGFEQRFGLRLLPSGYGQSECLMICNSVGREDEAPAGSMGFPAAGLEIRLFDDDDHEVATGEVGEVRIRPLVPHAIFEGYFDDEAATRAAFRGEQGEWYCTGDLARRDPSGALFFVDRKRDAIRFGGRNISTLEVESVLRRHPAVAEVAAYGIPSRELAQESELKVDVVPAEGRALAPEELARFLNDNAPHYFVPRYIDLVEALPYTPTNKVEKYKLRERGVLSSTWDRKAAGFVVER